MNTSANSVKPLLFSGGRSSETRNQSPEKSGHFRKRHELGHAVLEFALLSPWILFLFVGTLDMGFYTHALIATQNAARAAAAQTSRNALTAADVTRACQYALEELNTMSNVRGLSSCTSTPLIVTANSVTGIDGSPASSVSVTYRTNRLIPIPGLTGQLNITRTVQMMVR